MPMQGRVLEPLQRKLLCTNKDGDPQNSPINENQPKDDNANVNDDTYVENIRKNILSASLDFVSIEGWSEDALARGAQAIGYTPATHSLFPHGSVHLIHFFSMSCNAQLADKLKQTSVNSSNKNHLQIVEDAIVSRIEMLEPHKDTWSAALAKIMSSKMAHKYIESLLMFSDDVCYYAGDRSVDSRWYVKRVGVAGIYQASELHWLGNGTKPTVERLQEVRQFAGSQIKCASVLYEVPSTLSAIFATTKNILPISSNR